MVILTNTKNKPQNWKSMETAPVNYVHTHVCTIHENLTMNVRKQSNHEFFSPSEITCYMVLGSFKFRVNFSLDVTYAFSVDVKSEAGFSTLLWSSSRSMF